MLHKYLFLLFFLLGFELGAFAQTTTPNLDPGQLKGLTYSNNYFGFRIEIPKGWKVKTEEQKLEIQIAGYREVLGDSQKIIDETVAKTKILLYVSRYEDRPIEGSNPFLKVVAEDISGSVGATNIAYLANTKKYLEASLIKIKCKRFYHRKIKGKDFAILHAKIYFPGFSIKQKYYTILKDNYALTFTLSYITKEDKRALDNFFSTVIFE